MTRAAGFAQHWERELLTEVRANHLALERALAAGRRGHALFLCQKLMEVFGTQRQGEPYRWLSRLQKDLIDERQPRREEPTLTRAASSSHHPARTSKPDSLEARQSEGS